MRSILIESHFLPSLEYCCALFPVETIILEKHEHFNKQTYRNRCHILAVHGIERLSIPVTVKTGKVIITDVQIDYTSRWQMSFWRALQSAYAKAPYFEHYSGDLKKDIFSNQKFLYDLNFHLLEMCLQWLKWKKSIVESVSFEKNPSKEILDLRNVISAKKDFLQRPFYKPQAYHQVFGSNYVPNLSLIDLVFCVGPDATALIGASQKKN